MNFDPTQPERDFVSYAPGYWSDEAISAEDWNDHRWQLKHSVKSLPELERHLNLSQEERGGVLLTGNKLAMAITPHFFNLIDRDDPECPIRRQIIPRIEESWENEDEMADPVARIRTCLSQGWFTATQIESCSW